MAHSFWGELNLHMNILTILFKLAPMVLSLVISLEAAIPEGGKGLTKKEIILAVVDAAIKSGESIDNKAVNAIAMVVDSIVGILNKAGVFGK